MQRTEGITRSDKREGANMDENGVGNENGDVDGGGEGTETQAGTR